MLNKGQNIDSTLLTLYAAWIRIISDRNIAGKVILETEYIDQTHIDRYREDGAVLIKGLFEDWVDVIRAGIDHNMAEPGPYAAENLKQGEGGRFLMIIVTGGEYPNLKK